MHGKTRRGALVFDVADLVKDAIVLPWAFILAQEGKSQQEFRQAVLQKFTERKALDFMFEVVKKRESEETSLFNGRSRAMMVFFISRSEKNAISTTRNILDAFADRVGADVWRTVITLEGLMTVKTLLRKYATKSTAVACHWIRSRKRSELLWIVGRREKFNEEGLVPVNSTSKNILHTEWENGWDALPIVKALAATAALLHDLGKANDAFQKKLRSAKREVAWSDPYRHEWISCKLIQGLVAASGDTSSDDAWLTKLIEWDFDESEIIKKAESFLESDMGGLPPIASLISWLILSHHRLPALSKEESKRYFGEEKNSVSELLSLVKAKANDDWGYLHDGKTPKFSRGILKDYAVLEKKIRKWAGRLFAEREKILGVMGTAALRPLLSYARIAMMMGDYYVSSGMYEKKILEPKAFNRNTLYANSRERQMLEEHLLGVSEKTLKISHALPRLAEKMEAARSVQSLKRKSPPRFSWQDTAVEKIRRFRKEHEESGAWFIVNMASTGSGKTIANAKIMRAISPDGDSLRYILALGLRTLTLQTGTEYRKRIGLGEDELAVLVGDSAVKFLYDESNDESHSEDEEQLIDGELYCQNAAQDDFLDIFFKNHKSSKKNRAFLYTPVVAATIDHIVPAVEAIRGGRYMLPFLRLMSSDLVIDEVDDFMPSDLMAISRLVYLAGMLGRSVAISSATIPPDLSGALFASWREGREAHLAFLNRKEAVSCLWCDEFGAMTSMLRENDTAGARKEYGALHQKFSRQTLLLRHEQEKYLDEVLNRKGESSRGGRVVIRDLVVRSHLDEATEEDVMFIVVATSVEEIGRDHDFDWAVVEPSSCRSMIQLAGRVLRHRDIFSDISVENIAFMQYNLRGLTGEKVAFHRPGYETMKTYRLLSHDLKHLVDEEKLRARLDASPRIEKPKVLTPRKSLSHLEHQVIQDFGVRRKTSLW